MLRPKKKSFSTHETLAKFDPEIINIIKDEKETFDANQLNISHKSLLQIACAGGYVEAVLWLIYAGANINYHYKNPYTDKKALQQSEKPPLQLAVENEHYIIIQILCICKAQTYPGLAESDLSLSDKLIDSDVLSALLYWAIINYHSRYKDRFFRLLEPNLQKEIAVETKETDKTPLIDAYEEEKGWIRNLTGFSHLAAFKKCDQLALQLYQADRNKLRINEHLPTLAYWAIKSNLHGLYNTISKDDDRHIMITLNQLSHSDTNTFLTYFTKATPEQQILYKKYSLDTDEPDLSYLTAQQKKIITFSKYGNKHILESLLEKKDSIDILRDNEAIIHYMTKTMNPVLFHILSTIFNQKAFMDYAITKNSRVVLIMLMFAYDRYEFDLLNMSAPENWAHALNVLGENYSSKGIIRRMIKQATYERYTDKRSKQDISIQEKFFNRYSVSFDKFTELYMHSAYNIPNHLSAAAYITSESRDLFYRQARWFGFLAEDKLVKSAKTTFLQTTVLTTYLMTFLEKKDLLQLSRTCLAFNESSRIAEMIKIDELLKLIESEIESLSYFSYRRPIECPEFCLSVFLLILCVSIVVSCFTLNSTINLIDEYKHVPVSKETNRYDYDWCPKYQRDNSAFRDICWSVNFFRYRDDLIMDDTHTNMCASFCLDRRHALRSEIGEAFGLTISGLTLLTMLPCWIELFIDYFKRLTARGERVNCLPFNSIVSRTLQRQTQKRIDESHLDCTIDDSVKTVVDKITTLKNSISISRHHSLFIRSPKNNTALAETKNERRSTIELV